jgi:hypothetical protein
MTVTSKDFTDVDLDSLCPSKRLRNKLIWLDAVTPRKIMAMTTTDLGAFRGVGETTKLHLLVLQKRLIDGGWATK